MRARRSRGERERHREEAPSVVYDSRHPDPSGDARGRSEAGRQPPEARATARRSVRPTRPRDRVPPDVPRVPDTSQRGRPRSTLRERARPAARPPRAHRGIRRGDPHELPAPWIRWNVSEGYGLHALASASVYESRRLSDQPPRCHSADRQSRAGVTEQPQACGGAGERHRRGRDTSDFEIWRRSTTRHVVVVVVAKRSSARRSASRGGADRDRTAGEYAERERRHGMITIQYFARAGTCRARARGRAAVRIWSETNRRGARCGCHASGETYAEEFEARRGPCRRARGRRGWSVSSRRVAFCMWIW